MTAFEPGFDDLQKDIERYLTSTARREKRGDGTVVFHGYPDALEVMFDRYLAHEAFDPLVRHFRGWNWELAYDRHLMNLTAALIANRDWPRLERLWTGVIAKRRKLYNDAWKIENDSPGTLPARTLSDARERLLETLERVRGYAQELSATADTVGYVDMKERIIAGKRA